MTLPPTGNSGANEQTRRPKKPEPHSFSRVVGRPIPSWTAALHPEASPYNELDIPPKPISPHRSANGTKPAHHAKRRVPLRPPRANFHHPGPKPTTMPSRQEHVGQNNKIEFTRRGPRGIGQSSRVSLAAVTAPPPRPVLIARSEYQICRARAIPGVVMRCSGWTGRTARKSLSARLVVGRFVT